MSLTHHKANFDLDACWMLTATRPGKETANGVGAALMSSARRVTLSKSILLSTAKDFYAFSRKQRVENAK